MIKFTILIVRFYKYFLSPIIRPSCRYMPTCSDYFIDCLLEYGFIKGSLKGLKRISTCHPIKVLGGGQGYDPVKKQKKENIL